MMSPFISVAFSVTLGKKNVLEVERFLKNIPPLNPPSAKE